MPRVKLTKSVIDDLPTSAKDVVYWDAGCPGFGIYPSSSAGVGAEGVCRQAGGT